MCILLSLDQNVESNLLYQFTKYVLLEFSLVENTLAALGKVLQRTEEGEGIHSRSKAGVERIRCLDTWKC